MAKSQRVHNAITKTRLFRYIENFITKNWKFPDKNSDIFHISAQNIDCGYSYLFWSAALKGLNKKKYHYENMPIQIYRKFHLQKLKIFR